MIGFKPILEELKFVCQKDGVFYAFMIVLGEGWVSFLNGKTSESQTLNHYTQICT